VIAYASAGDFARLNPHLHGIFLEGGSDRQGRFVHVPSLDVDTLSQYFRSTMIAFFLKRTLINVEAKRSPIPMTSMHGGRAEPRGEGNLPPTRRPPPARQGRRDG